MFGGHLSGFRLPSCWAFGLGAGGCGGVLCVDLAQESNGFGFRVRVQGLGFRVSVVPQLF